MIHESVFVAQGAVIVGDVEIGENCGIWYNAVIRGDAAKITIGKNSNIQDCCVIHANENYPVYIGENVSIGHTAIIHSATIGNNVLIGMGAILMDDCVIGDNCFIAAGALVTKGQVVPAGSLVVGSPGKVRREVTEEDLVAIDKNTKIYKAFKKKNEEGLWDTHILDLIEE